MSRENIIQEQEIETNESAEKLSHKSKVDINVLLNKVRADQKKERFENLIFIGVFL